MITINIKYTFKNGIYVIFTIKKDPKHPIARSEWSCDLNNKNLQKIYKEYIDECVPYVYQKVADFIGQSILWVDSYTKETKRFEPIISSLN